MSKKTLKLSIQFSKTTLQNEKDKTRYFTSIEIDF